MGQCKKKNDLAQLGHWPRKGETAVSLPQIKRGGQKQIIIGSMLKRTANYNNSRFRHSLTASRVYHARIFSRIELKSVSSEVTLNVDIFQMETVHLPASEKMNEHRNRSIPPRTMQVAMALWEVVEISS